MKGTIILNLTQHAATEDQRQQSVVDCQGETLALLKELLTFNNIPSPEDIDARAEAIAEIAASFYAAMIGGAPYLMGPLEKALRLRGVTPMYAFTERVSEEAVMSDGSVKKTNVFRHVGFVVGQS